MTKTAAKKPPKHRKPQSIDARVQAYIDGVMSGEIVACKWVVLAVKRHLADLKTGGKRGLWFDEDEARRGVMFMEALPHSKGKWAGKLVPKQPWQCFIWWCVWGWKRADGKRRFRSVLVVVARKNGKSTDAAAAALKCLVCDGELGAEVYSLATKRDQAKIVWGEARKMVLKSPSLKKIISTYRDSLVVDSTESVYKPLGRDADTLDGHNPSAAIIDEIHAHKTREIWDVIESGVGARDQPLTIGITTAGDGSPETIYSELKKYVEDILSGSIADDTWFGIIYTLDEGDSWEDERVWIKANPNLGASVNIEDLRKMCAKAKRTPGAVANFRRKRMNEDVATNNPWLATDRDSAWGKCSGGEFYDNHGLTQEAIARFRGRDCWVGGDLSSLHDLTALSFDFPGSGDTHDLICTAWCPRENAIGRQKDSRVPYVTWADMGLIYLTDGNSVDYDEIRAVLRTARDKWGWNIRQIAFDPNNAAYLVTKLVDEDGFNAQEMVITHQQTCGFMNDPIAATEKAILDGRLRHGGHAVLTWCVSNVVLFQDTGDRRRFNKRHSREKIDLAVSMAMAIGRATACSGVHTSGTSIYDKLDHILFV